MELIDIGVNLGDKAFADDLDDVLERARAAGVGRMIVTGTSIAASTKAARLAADHPGQLWSTAGVHPHDAKSCDGGTIDALRDLATRSEVVAIGECGLDFNRDFSPRPMQQEWLEKQLELAATLDMPVFLHERDASATMTEILRSWRDRVPRAVVHCFTGTGAELRRYLDLDLHIGITGWICDERRGHHLHELVGLIPRHRLMLETDSPYLLPRTLRPRPKSRRNQPAYLPYVAETVADCLGLSAEEVAAFTTETARAFFGLA